MSMSIASLARRSPNLLRKLVALLVLAFSLGTIVHAGHSHEANKANDSYAACSYCTAFGSMLDTSVHVYIAPIRQRASEIFFRAAIDPVCKRILTAAQPRAPPTC
jgi:disulfide bond formation protein DsbB